MKLTENYCPREYSIKLKELGINNSVLMTDPDGSEFQVPKVGCFYSCMVGDRYFEGILGNQEDAPYKIYNPIEHYSLSQLLNAFTSESIVKIFMKYADDGESCIIVNYIATYLIAQIKYNPESVASINERIEMIVDPTPVPTRENPLDRFNFNV